MYVTLSILFLLFIIISVFYGWGIIMRRTSRTGEEGMGTCSVCRKKMSREKLLTREIGDYKILYFCGDCVRGLWKELEPENKKV
jgi:hypothetical protein